jgi:hypothetical protein
MYVTARPLGRSIVLATGCGSAFIAQVTLYSAVLGVAISLAWGVGMEPSGFEPLTPCMPWSLFIGVNPLHCRGFASLFYFVLRQTMSQN